MILSLTKIISYYMLIFTVISRNLVLDFLQIYVKFNYIYIVKILMNIFEIIWIIAWLSAAIPSIPQIFRTLKSKDVKWLSPLMFRIWAIWWVCWIIYGWYLGSWQMEFFNSITTICSVIMLILIWKYSKKRK